MLDPTLKKTAKHYIGKFFIPDFLSTVPTQIIKPFTSLRTYYFFLIYLRVVRVRKVPEAYSLLFRYYIPVNTTKHRIIKMETIAALVLYYV